VPPLYAFDQRNEGSVPDEMFGSADSDDFSQMKTAHEGSHDSLRSLHSAQDGDDL
jgi:hypothetical protein